VTAPWTTAHSAALLRSRVLTVNFHHIAKHNRAEVTERLRQATRLGRSLLLDDEQQDCEPSIFVAFYDGYHDTGLFGAELCHRLGIRAYFFPVFASFDPARGRLSDDDLGQIAQVHELGYHTTSHLRAAQITSENVDAEVLQPVERIRRITGAGPRIAAWRGGTRFDDQTLGDRTLRELGVGYLVSNWSIEAVPVSSPAG